MGAGGDDAALVDDHDAVGLEHGGEAVGDDEGGAVGHEAFQGLVHKVLALRVQ